jgi:outer membrane protein TolC
MLSYEEVGFSQDRAVATAMEMRPQLNARRTEKTSAEKSVNLASRSNNPVLKANAGYSWGDEDYTGNEELYLGVSVNVPIYDKGLAREKTREARFRVEEADAKLTALEQDVILEVEKAYMEVHDSIEAIDTAAKTVQQAMQNLELANGRYEVGVGSPVEVTDATENYISATNSYYTTLYDYWLALAALEKATGGIIE